MRNGNANFPAECAAYVRHTCGVKRRTGCTTRPGEDKGTVLRGRKEDWNVRTFDNEEKNRC